MLPFLSFPMIYSESELNYDNNKFNSKSHFERSSINNSNSRQDARTPDKEFSSVIEKAVIIIFDRGYKSQFTNAKPILDKYGFKASFFIICSFVEGEGYYKLTKGEEKLHDFNNAMSWDQIGQMHKEGHDIESHGMEHRDLRKLSSQDLEYEISKSKECLVDHGLKPTYFQYPSNKGVKNSTVLNMVSKYFDFGLADHSRLMFLGCDGWQYGFKTISYKYQKDCNPFSINDTHTHTNKYAIKEWSHDRYHTKLNNKYPNLLPHGDNISDLLFNEFVNVTETQKQYNDKAGKIVAIPIIGYHTIGNSSVYDTSEELFDKEMNYLHTNGFKVLKLTDLGYNEKESRFYIR
jgi:peptidoglycan/xylan/chitin deacetylase (PgdA/CDA1 family)